MTAVLDRDQLGDIAGWLASDLSPDATSEIHRAMRAALLEAVLDAAEKSQDGGAELLDELIQAAALAGYFLGASVQAGAEARRRQDQNGG